MKCAICEKAVGYGALMIALYSDRVETVTLCTRCRHTLLGAEVNERVAKLVRMSGWTQPFLPNFT